MKNIRLISGNEEGWMWNVNLRIANNGTYQNKGTFFAIIPSTAGKKQFESSRKVKGMGMCLICGDIDWRHLEEHHPDAEKMPDFTITLCANHHRQLHFDNGSFAITKKNRRQKW